MMRALRLAPGLLMFCFAVCSAPAKQIRATIIYDEVGTEIASAKEEAGQLWLTPTDLERATHFEIKPQGVCRGVLCFPLPKAKRQEFLDEHQGKTRFNLSAFAELVNQPVAHDEALATWYFGLRADQRQTLSSLEAPDFTLPDMNGKLHSLSEFRGKKVLLVTWASW
jgi:AhpC/TSA family